MSSLHNTSIDLSVFNKDDKKESNQQQQAICHDLKSCECMKRVLTALRYYSMLKVHSNKDDQTKFNDFVNTIYLPSDLIMDFFHFKNIHNQQIQQIMNHAVDYYKFPLCNIESCTYSSRLYRVNEAVTMINIFDDDDKTSKLGVVISLLDSIHHYIFHLTDCGLRDFVDKDGDNKMEEEEEEKEEKYHDVEFAVMSKRILSTQKNTKKFGRMKTGNKFVINISKNNDDDGDDELKYFKDNG